MRIRAAIVSTLLVLTVASCGSGESADPTVGTTAEEPATKPDGPDLSDKDFEDLTAESDVVVLSRDNRFVEPYIEVKAGTEVTFDNTGRNQHNVIPVEPGAFPEIATDDFPPGATGTVNFEVPGDYPYYCSLHGTTTKGMVGAVRVLE